MKNYEDYLDEEIYAIDKKISSALSNKVYFAYKNGVSQEFQTEKEARNFSHLIEIVDKNEEYKKSLRAEKKELLDKRYKLWLADLREEYREYNDDQFQIFYSMAYEYHSGSKDDVVTMMEDLTHMYEQVKGAAK